MNYPNRTFLFKIPKQFIRKTKSYKKNGMFKRRAEEDISSLHQHSNKPHVLWPTLVVAGAVELSRRLYSYKENITKKSETSATSIMK